MENIGRSGIQGDFSDELPLSDWEKTPDSDLNICHSTQPLRGVGENHGSANWMQIRVREVSIMDLRQELLHRHLS